MKLIHFAIMSLMCASLWSCSNGNDNSVVLDPTGKHPALWAVATTGGAHPAEYILGPGKCVECHGSDLRGGISNVSCFSATRSGIGCHPDGPGHGAGFASAGQHGAKAKINLVSCQVCHATPTSGGNPRFNVVKNSLANGCETCHVAGTAHPTPWLPGRGVTNGVTNATSHATAGNLAGACTLCHGAALNGVGGTAPSCMSAATCHTTSPLATPTGCTSCHGRPPNGVTTPNQAFAHTAHVFPNVACAACHNGLGAGTATHANGIVDVALSPSYQAKTVGAPAWDTASKTCTNVRCHGGQTTPPWPNIGAIDVNTACRNCHELGTTQYNSYHSGEHAIHTTSFVPNCTDCHNTTRLVVNHFTNLDSPEMEGLASNTIVAGTSGITFYDPITKNCTASCHIDQALIRNWGP